MKHRHTIPIGARVKSRFRAPWTGVIREEWPTGEACYLIEITHDRNGRPFTGPRRLRTLAQWWLEVLDRRPGNPIP